MSEKILWNTIKIQVPNEFITVTKNGSIKIRPPVTKKNRIATSNKQPAIEFVEADVNEVSIIDQGRKEISDKKIYKTKQKAINESKIQQVRDDYKIKVKENNLMESEDVNVSKPKGNRFIKGSEAAIQWGEQMRNMRKK